MYRRLCAAAVASMVLAQTAMAAAEDARPDLPIEGVITKPEWVQKPGPNDFSDNYPPLANALRMGGVVQITCAVTAGGSLENCKVDNEAPTGFGFGPAALEMSRYFRMKPATLDGAPIAGSTFTTRIRFTPADQGPSIPAPSAPAAAPKPASSAALELGRQVAALLHISDLTDRSFEAYFANMRKGADGYQAYGVTKEQVDAAFDALEKAKIADLKGVTDAIAGYYAGAYSEAELRQLVDFLSSPLGRSWIGRQQDQNAAFTRAINDVMLRIESDAGRQLCAPPACAGGAAASASASK